MRVLVTGATTPVGASIVRGLVESGAEIVLAITGPGESPPELGPKVEIWPVDLTRPRDIWTFLFGPALDAKVDVLVHTALHRSAGDSGRRVRALNVGSTRELLHHAEAHPTLRRFVLRSFAEVYRIRAEEPTVIEEDHPLELSPRSPQWVRDRVEVDLSVSVRMGMSKLSIAVLRAAECLAPASGSQLYDYFTAPVCFRPLGFDPMMNLSSPADIARAVGLAARSSESGIFNIPGRDTLPLSEAIRLAGRTEVPAPGVLLAPLYKLRSRLTQAEFRYDLNAGRFQFGGVLDGRRSREILGYEPRTGVDWEAIRGAAVSATWWTRPAR